MNQEKLKKFIERGRKMVMSRICVISGIRFSKALDELEKAVVVIEAAKEDSKIAKVYGWNFTEFEQALKKWEADDE